MSYLRNKQFLLASQRYYQAGNGTKDCDPCGYTGTSYRSEKYDPCQTDPCYKPEKCDPCQTDACYKPEKCDPCQTDACHKPEKCDPCTHQKTCRCDVCRNRNIPETITDVLCSLINEQVQVTTPFGAVTGTLLDVKRDYIIILENNGDRVLVRTGKIELVSPMT